MGDLLRFGQQRFGLDQRLVMPGVLDELGRVGDNRPHQRPVLFGKRLLPAAQGQHQDRPIGLESRDQQAVLPPAGDHLRQVFLGQKAQLFGAEGPERLFSQVLP